MPFIAACFCNRRRERCSREADRNVESCMSKLTTCGSVFYGWFIVAAGFAAMFCLGEVMWSFGVFFTEFEAEFGWSRSTISLGYTLMAVGYAMPWLQGSLLTDTQLAPYFFRAHCLEGWLSPFAVPSSPYCI